MGKWENVEMGKRENGEMGKRENGESAKAKRFRPMIIRGTEPFIMAEG